MKTGKLLGEYQSKAIKTNEITGIDLSKTIIGCKNDFQKGEKFEIVLSINAKQNEIINPINPRKIVIEIAK